MIKVIVTDMDGTLLDDQHQINEEFWDTLTELKNRGITFSVASGRQYYNLLERFKGHENDIIFIAENGTIVMKNHKELFIKELDVTAAHEFIKISRELDEVYVVLCGKNSAYIESNDVKFKAVVDQFYHHCEIVEDLLIVKDQVLKVALFHFNDSEHKIYPFYKKFENDFKVVVSGKTWVDIMDKDINKGVALKGIKDKLGLTSHNVLAFGDYLNDYEMMQEAEYSFAMANAHEELKKVAKYRAPSNNENGVVDTIKRFLSKNNEFLNDL